MRMLSIGLALAFGVVVAADDKKDEKKEAKKKPPVPVALGEHEIMVSGEWLKQRPASTFRVLQWGIPTAEGDEKAPVCYVSEFPGGVGSVDANVKRWEGEYEEKDGEAKKEKVNVEGVKITMVDVSGSFKDSMGRGPVAGGKVELRKGYRTLAAMIEPEGGDKVYTVKMVGPKKSVGAQRDDFVTMLKSMKKK
jgi:hypothetical protein